MCPQGFSQDFKTPCSKEQFQNFCLSRFSSLYFKSLFQLHLIAFLVRTMQFSLQLCPRRWFIGKIFYYNPQKVKIEKNSIEIFACPKRSISRNCLSKRQAGRVLAKSLSVSLVKGTSWHHAAQNFTHPLCDKYRIKYV